MDTNEFRHKLDEATQGFPRKHIKRIADLNGLYPHNIRLYGNPNVFDNDDCFLYVFRDRIPSDLLTIFENLVTDNSDLFEDIGHDLISKGFISLHNDQRGSDTIAVYFAGGAAKHFGRIEGNRIISKWGRGYAWKHDLFEVPLSYGNTVKFSNGEIDEDVFRKIVETHSRRRAEAQC